MTLNCTIQATLRGLLAVVALAVVAPIATASEPARQLEWDDLMPPDWDPFANVRELQDRAGRIADGTAEADALMREFIAAGRSAPVVNELDGQAVKLPGFIVPLDFEGKEVSEFLLVPYFGACIHVPPPPANQIVYVRTPVAHAIEELFDPVWVTGTLKTKAHLNEVGDAGYTLEATVIEPYTE